MPKEFLDQLLESKSFYPNETHERRVEIAASIVHEWVDENAAAKITVTASDTTNPVTEEVPEDLTFSFEQINGSPLTIKVEATESGELLRFRNGILAQAEVNKNSDVISKENIDELAATLAGRAIDISHDERVNAGVITAARSVLYKGNPAVAIDGLGWRDRYPEEWDGVRAGTHHLSVEADAQKAVCSICAGEFKTSKEYCDHLKNRRMSGAKRGFIGLTGKGAGITPDPAGTDTHFDREQIFVVAHQEEENIVNSTQTEPPGGDGEQPKQETRMDKCPRCNADVTADATTCPSCHKGMEASVIAADLKASELEVEARKAELDKALAELEALKPVQAKAESEEAAKIQAEANVQTTEAKLAEKTAELETAKTELKASQDKLAEIKATQREAEIKPLLTPEAWTERQATFQAMDDETFSTVAASLRETAKKPAQAQIGIRSGMPEPVAGSDNGKSKISLR